VFIIRLLKLRKYGFYLLTNFLIDRVCLPGEGWRNKGDCQSYEGKYRYLSVGRRRLILAQCCYLFKVRYLPVPCTLAPARHFVGTFRRNSLKVRPMRSITRLVRRIH
jgi:hypothetical protein